MQCAIYDTQLDKYFTEIGERFCTFSTQEEENLKTFNYNSAVDTKKNLVSTNSCFEQDLHRSEYIHKIFLNLI